MLNPHIDLEQWGPIDGNILFASFWYKPMSGGIKKKWGIGWADMVVIIQNGHRLTAWWDKRQLEREGEEAICEYLLKPSRLRKLLDSYEKSREHLLSLNDKILRTSSERFDPSLGKIWYEGEMDFWYDATVFEIINYGATTYLRSRIEKRIPEAELEQVLTVLLAPEKRSFHKRSEVELYKLVAENGDINKYTKKWYWVDNSYLESKHLTTSEFKKRVNKLTPTAARKKIEETNRYFKDVLSRKREIIRNFGLTLKDLKLARALSWSLWIQDERKGTYWKVIAGLEKLCRWASQKYSVPYEDLILYPAEAWRDLMTRGIKLPDPTLNQIRRFTLFDTGEGRYKILLGQKAELLARAFKGRDKIGKIEGLRGLGVSHGKARGRVKVLTTPRLASKLKWGEVLVAQFTSPDFVVAMRKAKAIITDIGGLTSHAAVVSRELGIPCVVGTKHATRILKDGDLVEVDGNSGIIKIIRSKK